MTSNQIRSFLIKNEKPSKIKDINWQSDIYEDNISSLELHQNNNEDSFKNMYCIDGCDHIERLKSYMTTLYHHLDCKPYDTQYKKYSQKIFIKPLEVDIKKKISTTFNHSEGMKTMVNFLTAKSSNQRSAFIIAKKGIGKTYTLSYFLNVYTEELESKDVFWFKIDMNKVYHVWQSFIKYYYSHVLYVVGNNIKNVSIFRSILDNKKNKDFRNFLLNQLMNNNLNNHYDNYDDDKVMKLLLGYTNLQKKTEKEFFKLDKIVAHSILKYMKEKLFKKIVIFIDGIDNIDYKVFDEYIKYLEEIKSLNFIEEDSSDIYHKIIITCREDTVRFFYPKPSRGHGSSKRFILATLNPLDIVKKRNKMLKNILPNIENYKDCEIKKLYDDLRAEFDYDDNFMKRTLKEFEKYSLEMSQVLIDFINKNTEVLKALDTVSGRIENEIELLKIVFNSNIRNYLHYFLYSYGYVSHYAESKNIKLSFRKKDNNYIVEYVRERPFLLIESLFLNGMVYSSREKDVTIPYSANDYINLFNIINWNKLKEKELIKGKTPNALSFIYLLSYLAYYSKSKNEEQIAQYFYSNFGYCNKTIHLMIWIGLEFGYIDRYANPIYANRHSEKSLFDPLFSTTSKGKFCINYIWQDLDILYVYSLGIQINRKIILNKKLINVFRSSNEKSWINYKYSKLKTSITFLRYFHLLRKSNNIDIEIFKIDCSNYNLMQQIINLSINLGYNDNLSDALRDINYELIDCK